MRMLLWSGATTHANTCVAFAAFPLSLAFWRGRVEGAIGLEVVPVLVVERAPNLFGRVASGSAAVGAVRGNVANFTAGIAGLVSWRPTRARTSACRRFGMGIRGTVRGTSRRVSRGRFTRGGKRLGTLPCFFRFPLFRLGRTHHNLVGSILASSNHDFAEASDLIGLY